MDKVIRSRSNSEWWLLLLLTCTMAPSLAKISCAIAGRMPVINFAADYFDIIVTVIALLFSFPVFYRKLKKEDALLYLIDLFIYLLQYVFFTENIKYLNEYFVRSMLAAVPMFYIGRIWDIKQYDRFFYVISLIGIVWMSFYYLYYIDNSKVSTDYDLQEQNMAASYQILFLLCYVSWYTFRHFTIIGMLGVLLGMFSVFSFGTRGPLLCYIFFVTMYMLFFVKTKYKLWYLILFIIISYLIFLYFEVVAMFIMSILNRFGMSTRIIDLVLMRGVEDETTMIRGDIITTLMNQLNHGNQIAYGLFGSWNYTGNYSHRIYIDFFFNFGYFLGSVIMAFLAYVLWLAYKACKNVEERGLWILLVSVGLIPLFFSSYFLFWGNFYVLYGYCVTLIYKKKNKKSFTHIKAVDYAK